MGENVDEATATAETKETGAEVVSTMWCARVGAQ